VALTLVVTLGLTWFVSNQVRQASLANLEAHLLADARLLADRAEPFLQEDSSRGPLEQLAGRWAELLEARITIVAPDGTVLAESHTDAAQMDNHLGREEVQAALNTGQGGSLRFSNTLGYEMMYAALPVRNASDGQFLGLVRVALPLAEIEENLVRLRRSIVTAGLVAAVLAALIALVIAERTVRPLRRLTAAAERLAKGDLESQLLPSSSGEIGHLTLAFNHMADQLQAQMGTLAEERGRLEAVLDHMADGVLITDEGGQVQLINAATARLLKTSEAEALGRTFAQVVPHHQIIELWKACRESGEEQVDMVDISRHDLFVQAIISPFEETGARGYLVILQDLTRVRRLETVRRDFISNISHELRTPLAGLKALVDTLRGGAIKDPPAAKRFLKRMDTEVDTLTQMVQELLELSRVESGQAPLRLEPTPPAEIVIPPLDRLRPQAERAGVELAAEVASGLPLVRADAERAQMVVTNLVHNALKFTPPGGTVTATAGADGIDVIFSVADTGVGIPSGDLTRIFERFYKADRARSGGGTGLGLAIAKHIVEGHGGRIWAESVEGEGSTFHFSLPATT
jgi:two-component system phosphate regulon sensor histidine kinase PhoR